MSDGVNVPKWYWVAGIVLLAWGAMGIFAFYSQLTTPYDQMVAEMGKLAADCMRDMPSWMWWVYGVAVWSGLFGSVSLLLRRGWAQPLYAISLIAVVVQFGYSFLVQHIHVKMGPQAAIFPAFIILIAAVQLWLATSAKKKAWLQ